MRIHTDDTAGAVAHQLRARAVTTGNRIFFAPGQFQPDRTSGRRLIAHELAHGLQRRGLARMVVQRETHSAVADYQDPDNCWAFADRQPTPQVIVKIEGALEVPAKCQGTIRMTSRFRVVGNWRLSDQLGSGGALKLELNRTGTGLGQLTSAKSAFENTITYPLASSDCSTSFAVYVLMIWLRGGPKNFFEVKFSPSVRLDGEGRLHETSPDSEIRVDPCGRLHPTPVDSPKPLMAPFGVQPEP